MSSVQYPNGQTSVYDYFPGISVGLPGDGDFRLKKIAHFRATSELLSSYEYGYDLEGMIRSMTTTIDAGDARTSTFRYDLADQLVAATIPIESGARSYTYAYDLSGNRTSQLIDSQLTVGTHNNVNQLKAIGGEGLLRVRGSTNEAAQVTANGVAAASVGTDFEAHVPISPGGRLLEVDAVDANSNVATKSYSMMVEGALPRDLTYDLNGNLTSDGQGATYTWDAENRLVGIAKDGTTTEFSYDGLSRRTVEKVNGSVSKRWIWTDRTQPCEERDSTNVRKKGFYSAGQLIGSNSYYYNTDQLGSIREMTDVAGGVRARYEYDPYGKALKTNGDLESDFGFTGLYRHQFLGLNLALYRSYDAHLGRWISRDPMGEADGPNLYSYVGNEPIAFVDLLGLYKLNGPISPTGAASTVVTDGRGGLRIHIGDDRLTQPEIILRSIRVHEGWHRHEALMQKPDIGVNQPDGIIVGFSDDIEQFQGEINACIRQRDFLRRALADPVGYNLQSGDDRKIQEYIVKTLNPYLLQQYDRANIAGKRRGL